VVERAARAGLGAIALTDHDTLGGIPEAVECGERLGLRVIAGCEFSVAVPWGEMHLLGYFLPTGYEPLEELLRRSRADRERRGLEIASRLRGLGVDLPDEAVLREAGGAAVGRPHVARALCRLGLVATEQEAFDRYIGWGRPANVPKKLPPLREVARIVHEAGGVVSAAHLKERGSRNVLTQLQVDGLDAVETRHPTHTAEIRARLTDHALALGLLRTGGSDWHGDAADLTPGGLLGGQEIPAEWLDALEAARPD